MAYILSYPRGKEVKSMRVGNTIPAKYKAGSSVKFAKKDRVFNDNISKTDEAHMMKLLHHRMQIQIDISRSPSMFDEFHSRGM